MLLLTSLAGALAGGWLAHMLTQTAVPLQGGSALPCPRMLAPFVLTDTRGRRMDNAALRGHATLLYFGFTACPDACPATLAMLREMHLQRPGGGPQVWFITVDPDRDTPAVLAEYLAAYSRDFVGLRAGPAALAPLLQTLSAYAGRRELAGGQYGMDHSATLYLLDRRARLVAVFTPPFTAAVLGADLLSLERQGRL